ncbi:MAG: SoxR reducing system RseC family protein [Candidatus Marinimicrobia bacterium]|nr:SoxR reducing system RseC family protein [Candidatus Neomarinimicrobiota bacterium]
MLFNGETGIVQALDDTQITIAFSVRNACDNCSLKVICSPGKQSGQSLTMPNSGHFSIGQRIRIEEGSNLELHLALTQFGLPLLLFLSGLILGYILPQSLFPKELMAFLTALLGLGISFFVARRMVQRITDSIPEKYLRIVALKD